MTNLVFRGKFRRSRSRGDSRLLEIATSARCTRRLERQTFLENPTIRTPAARSFGTPSVAHQRPIGQEKSHELLKDQFRAIGESSGNRVASSSA
jgi:hypothetical protein